MARAEYDVVHQYAAYDLVIDTATTDPRPRPTPSSPPGRVEQPRSCASRPNGLTREMAFPPLPDPVPKYLPPGFEPLHEHALEANSVPIATGPTTPVDGPMTSKMRMYVFGPASFEAMKHGPAIHVIGSYRVGASTRMVRGLAG